MYYVYILKCSDDTLYTGITTDLGRRIDEHNGVFAGGAKYTSSRNPVVLAHYQLFPDRSSASKEEYRIKKLSRKQKQKLINIE